MRTVYLVVNKALWIPLGALETMNLISINRGSCGELGKEVPAYQELVEHFVEIAKVTPTFTWEYKVIKDGHNNTEK